MSSLHYTVGMMLNRDERLAEEQERARRDASAFENWEAYRASRPTLTLLSTEDLEEVRAVFHRHRSLDGFLEGTHD
jgi:hypothetical protein